MTRGPDSLPSVPGHGLAPVVDVEAGVARLMGNRHIYLRALARFRSDYRNAGAAIRAALEAGDIALAQRLAHTLKGAAGMIEAGALQAAALALEGALCRAGSELAPYLACLDGELSDVLRELDAMAPLAQEPAPPATPVEPDAARRLRAMLDIGNGAAVELVAAARAELVVQLGEGEYEGLRAAVMMFDYERALELLDRPRRTGK
jgi:HPt (histidine-containing phosphotransfer) domain-containing protein